MKKIRTNVRAGGISMNHSAKKLAVKRARGGLAIRTTVKAGKKGA